MTHTGTRTSERGVKRINSFLKKIRRLDGSKIKTMTITKCDPANCPYERCPMHDGTSNPFPVKDEADTSDDPSVLVLPCNQNPLMAKILIDFGERIKRRQKRG